jgi:hypothetical protein
MNRAQGCAKRFLILLLRYIYHHRHRYHDSCGVLFVPDEGSWCPRKNPAVKCWTWPDLESVKFLARLGDSDSNMDSMDPGNVVVDTFVMVCSQP